MAKFVFVYHGGSMPESEEEGAKVMAAWGAWLESISATDPGAPFGASKTVHPGGSVADDGGANPASGYTIVEAGDQDAAADIARGCPILDAGGTVEVCPAMEM